MYSLKNKKIKKKGYVQFEKIKKLKMAMYNYK